MSFPLDAADAQAVFGPLAGGVSWPVGWLQGVAAGGLAGPGLASAGPAVAGLEWLSFGFEGVVRTATGPTGLAIIFVYSFLIAFALPGVSEIVLAAAPSLDLGLALPLWATTAIIILVSGVGKAAGSVFAFHIGQEAKESGVVIRALERSRFDVIEWSRSTTATVARKWGYAGLALALCVPFFPDTISIYAFAILERDYVKFAAATFVGSVGRLLVTIALGAGLLAVV